MTALKASYPAYFISKNKIELTPDIDVDAVLEAMKVRFKDKELNTADGVRIDFEKEWVHLRKSNTEPIIRIYAESGSMPQANDLALMIINEIKAVTK
jgi:phosphomannomutase